MCLGTLGYSIMGICCYLVIAFLDARTIIESIPFDAAAVFSKLSSFSSL